MRTLLFSLLLQARASATLGVRAEQQFVFGDAALGTLHASVAWRRTVGAAPRQTTAFPAATALPPPAYRLAAMLCFSVPASTRTSPGLDLSADYSGQLGSNGQTHNPQRPPRRCVLTEAQARDNQARQERLVSTSSG